MPMDRALYPANWEAIALQLKGSVNWTCEDCKRPCRRPGEAWEEFCDRLMAEGPRWYRQTYDELGNDDTGEWGIVQRPQRFTLTVAHLDHRPQNCDRSNLRALCAPCHCRYDLSQMGRKRMLKLEREGQLNLFQP